MPATVRLWSWHEESPTRDRALVYLRDGNSCLVATVEEVVIGRVAVNSPSPSMLPSGLSSRSNNQPTRLPGQHRYSRSLPLASFGPLFARIHISCLLRVPRFLCCSHTGAISTPRLLPRPTASKPSDQHLASRRQAQHARSFSSTAIFHSSPVPSKHIGAFSRQNLPQAASQLA